MSMQQSEAHQDRMREIMADGAPPPSAGALARITTKHAADARRRAAARRLADEVAEARALGVAVVVKLTVDASWTESEDAVVRALNPDYTRTQQRLPHRSREAIKHRATTLDIKKAAKLWTQPEIATLKRLWSKSTSYELTTALPRWSRVSIDRKARHLNLTPRGQAPLHITGNVLCDAIRDRCRTLGYSMAYLDRIANAGTYFSAGEWKNKSGHRNTPMIRAVNALGGILNVEWPD